MRILCHNCYWFQGHPFETDAPGDPDPDVLSRLAGLYVESAADVILLQEVQSQSAFDQIRHALGMDGHYTPGRELPQYGGAAFWREGRLVDDSLSADAPVQRMWQIVEAGTADETVTVANLHLLAGRQVGADEARRRRPIEAASAVDRDVPPDAIMGDFNEPSDEAVGELLAGRGYSYAAELPGGDPSPTGVRGGRGDLAWISKGLLGRFTAHRVLPQVAFGAEPIGKETLSDHMPHWVDLDTGGDRS